MAGGIAVEAVDEGEKIGLAGGGRQLVLPGGHADLDGLLGLVGDIDLGGGILADKDNGKPRREAVLCLQLAHCLGDTAAQAFGICLAVDDLGHSEIPVG